MKMSNYFNSGFMYRIIFVLLVFLLLALVQGYAQVTGSISGSVIDNVSGEKLISATVQIVGSQQGTMTDLEGNYILRNLKPGTYKLKVSYVSYSPVIVENVVVKENQNTKIDFQMVEQSTKMQEIVVSAEKINSNENAILRIQKSSVNIVDGLSLELIKKVNSSDGAEALKRMTGVTVSDGKYAFIRGVGDRYNNTQLNESNLPSTDPEKKSFSYDLIPSNIIENMITSKTFTPDKPGDFSGGLIQIKTIDFPPDFLFSFSATGSYNTATSFKTYKSYEGGAKDYLGYDDGTRSMPNTINGQKVTRGNYSDAELNEIGLSFKNNWNTKNEKSPLNGSYKLSFGNRYNFEDDKTFGYVASLSYSSAFEIKDIEKNNYTFEGPRYQYKGTNFNQSIFLSGLLNIGFKFTPNSKISLKNIINQVSDNDITSVKGNYYYTEQVRDITSLKYLSRSLFSSQLQGEHFIDLLNGLNFDWNFNYAVSKREEPDARRFVYARDMLEPQEPFRCLLDQSLTTRFYGNLDDKNYGFSSNFLLKAQDGFLMPNIKTGINIDYKERDFGARSFGFRNIAGGDFLREEEVLLKPISEIFVSQNFGNKFIEVNEITKPSDSYTSDQLIVGTYLMFDFKFDNLRIVTGLRYENSNQNLYTTTQTGDKLDIKNKYDDFLPALSLTFSLNESSNLRFAFSNTLARPEFREIAPFSYFDFISNEIVVGNEKLKRSKITNVDFRYEFYPSIGEIMALSFFYKHFNDPIEEVLLASSGFEPLRSFENSEMANNYGFELEVRKNFGFISSSLIDLSFIGNYTVIESKIKLNNANGFQQSERALQGQAPTILNLGLYYDNAKFGLSSNVVYNKLGDKISKVGYAGLGDIIEEGRDQIDFSISKSLPGYFNIKFVVKDLLAQDVRFMQKTSGEDVLAENYKRGRSIYLGFSYDVK